MASCRFSCAVLGAGLLLAVSACEGPPSGAGSIPSLPRAAPRRLPPAPESPAGSPRYAAGPVPSPSPSPAPWGAVPTREADGTLRFVSVPDGAPLAGRPPVPVLNGSWPKISATGRYASFLGVEGTVTRPLLWDVRAGAELPAPGLPEGVLDWALDEGGETAVVLARGDAGRQRLYLWQRRQGAARPLPEPLGVQQLDAVAISGDGRWVAATVSLLFGDRDIRRLRVGASTWEAPAALATRADEEAPALSRDGRFLVYQSDRAGSLALEVYDALAQRSLTLGGPEASAPIAFAAGIAYLALAAEAGVWRTRPWPVMEEAK